MSYKSCWPNWSRGPAPPPPPPALFSHDVTAAMLAFQNKGMAAMMVYQTNPPGIELYFYANTFLYFSNPIWLQSRLWKRSVTVIITTVSLIAVASTTTTQLNKVEPKANYGASGCRYTVHVWPWSTAYSQLESAVSWFLQTEGNRGNPEKNPRSKVENQCDRLNPLMALRSGPGIDPWPHWWEVSALTAAQILH